MLMSGVFSFLSCAGNSVSDNDARIRSFSYHFDGTIGGNTHTYTVRVADDGTATLTVEDMRHYDYGEITDTVGSDFVRALEELCVKHNVRRYNGFDKVNRFVSDGSGFSLYITYANGKTVNAHGMNDFPAGFRDFSDDLQRLFEPCCERLYAVARQKKIEKGVSGEPTFIMANFIQSGSSGSDRYEVMISRQGIRQYNYEVRVRSCSGDFFPVGEFSCCTVVPDNEIDWKGFARLVRKYGLTNWMDYEATAEDYANSEWFQLNLSFEEGRIDAMGTLHPDNYDDFRRDFLTMLGKAVKKHGLMQKTDN